MRDMRRGAPSNKILERPLFKTTRPGFAWLYRGLYVGVARRGVDLKTSRQVWDWVAWSRQTAMVYSRRSEGTIDLERSVLAAREYAPQCIDELWQKAYDIESCDGCAPDGLPWELHEICDPVARGIALVSFWENLA